MTRSPVLRTVAALVGYAAAVLLVQDAGAATLDAAWAVVLAVATALGRLAGGLATVTVGVVSDPQRLVDLTLTAVTVVLGLLGAAAALSAWWTLGTRERTPDVDATEGATVVRLPDRAQPTFQRDAA